MSQTHTGSSAVLWQGFHHKWHYNHRFGRFGSYVEHISDSEAKIVHGAQSGWGPDVADYSENYTIIHDAQGVQFITGKVQFKGKECERLEFNRFSTKKTVDLPEGFEGCEDYTVVLNGFHLHADNEFFVDKLMEFSINIVDVKKVNDRQLEFTVEWQVQNDCRSAECWADLIKAYEDKDARPLLPKKLIELIDRHKFFKLLGRSDVGLAFAGDIEDTDVIEDLWQLDPEQLGLAESSSEESIRQLATEALAVYQTGSADTAEVLSWEDLSMQSAELSPQSLTFAESGQREAARIIRALIKMAEDTYVKGKRLAKIAKKHFEVELPASPYNMEIHYAVVLGKQRGSHLKVFDEFSMRPRQLVWDEHECVFSKGLPPPLSGSFDDFQARDGFVEVPAFTGLSLRMKLHGCDEANQVNCAAMHYMRWGTALGAFEKADGKVDVDLLFSTWEAGMEKSGSSLIKHFAQGGNVAPVLAKVRRLVIQGTPKRAHKFAGSAVLDAKLVLLQMQASLNTVDGQSAPDAQDKIVWGGIVFPDKSNKKDAVKKRTVTYVPENL